MAFCSGPFMHSFALRANASFFSQFLGEFWREDECKLSDGEFDVSVQSADGRSSLHGLARSSGCRLNWSIMSLSDGEREGEGRQTNWLSPDARHGPATQPLQKPPLNADRQSPLATKDGWKAASYGLWSLAGLGPRKHTLRLDKGCVSYSTIHLIL